MPSTHRTALRGGADGIAMTLSLIVFSGLPGTGKSTLASAVGQQMGIPVLRIDDVLASAGGLLPAHPRGPAAAADLLLTNLADRSLDAGQSVILDSIAADADIHAEWREMAAIYEARFSVIICVCSDHATHRTHLRERGRHPPEQGDAVWLHIEQLRGTFVPWGPDALTVDAVHPLANNLRAVFAYLARV